MKYLFVLLFVAVASLQRTSGDNDFLKNEFNYITKQVEEQLEKILTPLISEGHHLFEKLQKMKAYEIQINANTAQCKEFEATLKKVEAIVQDMTLTVHKTTLKVKQDILNIQVECAKTEGTILDIIKCDKQHFSTVLEDIQDMQPAINSDLQAIRSYSKTVQDQFQQCLKSQVVTTAKPQVKTTPKAAPTPKV